MLKAKHRISGIFGPLELPGVEVLEIDRQGRRSAADGAGLAGIRVEQDAGFIPIAQHATRVDREEVAPDAWLCTRSNCSRPVWIERGDAIQTQ